MKKKDLTALIITIVVIAVGGFLIYSQLGPGKKSANKPAQVEVVDPISSDYDASALAKLRDPAVAKDFTVPISLENLGNSAPYGPLR